MTPLAIVGSDSGRARTRAGTRRRLGAAVGPRCGPTSLRCSRFGRVAELASLTSFAALGQLRQVSQRCALRAPTEALRSSAPHISAAGCTPASLRGDSWLVLRMGTARASSPACALKRACGARKPLRGLHPAVTRTSGTAEAHVGKPPACRAPAARIRAQAGLDARPVPFFNKTPRCLAKPWPGGGRSASATARSAGLRSARAARFVI